MCYHHHCIFTRTSTERSRWAQLLYKCSMCSRQGWLCDGSHSPRVTAVLSPVLTRSRVRETELSIVQCLCSLKQRKQTQRAEKKGGEYPPPNNRKQRRVEGREGLGISFSAQMSWGVCGSPSLHLIVLPCHFISVPRRLLQRRLRYLLWFIVGWGICPLAHLDCPRWFSTGTWLEPLCFSVWAADMLYRLPAGRPAPWPIPCTAFLSLLCFSLLFFFPLSSPPWWWKSRSDFPGLRKGEQAWGADALPPISAFPILCGMETLLWGNGVSNRLRLPPALNGGSPAAINKSFSPTVESFPSAGLQLGCLIAAVRRRLRMGKAKRWLRATQTCHPCIDV